MLKPWFAFFQSTSGMAETERFVAGCGWALFALTALWAVFFVPMNMDEALSYHILACLDHPFAHLHVFQEGCDGRYDLVTFFGFRIPGAYHYVGALSSILYAPFYFLFHAPAAQYWFGLAFFLIFALALSGLTPKPQLSLPIILSFFPFIFQFIHDTGPVKFSLLAFPLGALLLRRITSERAPLQFVYAAALAALMLMAAEDKIFFVYLLPSFVFFGLAFVDARDWEDFFARLKKSGLSLLLAAALVLAGLLTLLFAKMGGDTYLGHLRHVQTLIDSKDGPDAIFRSSLLLTLAWPAYAHRVFDMQEISVGPILASIALTAAFLTVCFILARRRKIFQPLRPRAELLILSIFAALFVFLGLGNVWAGHHFIFLWVPALVLFADFIAALTPGALLGVTLAFFALSGFSVLALTQAPLSINMTRERAAIDSYFADETLASQSIVNYSSWGGYFIHALYAPKNLLVTYIDPLDTARAQKLLEISRLTKRRIYDVCLDPLRGTPFEGLPVHVGAKSFTSTCDKSYLTDRFGGALKFKEVMPGLNVWHVFEGTAP